MIEPSRSGPSMILYQTEDGRTRVQCRVDDETIWLTQALIAELFEVTPPECNTASECDFQGRRN